MAYIKLNEVELVDTPIEPNILIEVDGEIQRMPAENLVIPQVQANWYEDDVTKPGYILNKPESFGGGAKVVTYTDSSGTIYDSNGNLITAQNIVDEWNAGSILRYKPSNGINYIATIDQIYYTVVSGVVNSVTFYYPNSGGTISSVIK